VKRATALSPTSRAQCLVYNVILGLAPQALFCHLLRRFSAHAFARLLRRSPQHSHHCVVEEAVGGEELFVVDVEGFVFEVCDFAAGFGDQ